MTFQNLPMLWPGQIRIRHPGMPGTFRMNGLTFTGPQGEGVLWVDAGDTDGTTPALALEIVSPQGAVGAEYTTTSGGDGGLAVRSGPRPYGARW